MEQNFSTTEIPVFFLFPIIFIYFKKTKNLPTKQKNLTKQQTTMANHKNQSQQQTKPPEGAGKSYDSLHTHSRQQFSAMLFEPSSAQ